MSKGIFSDPLVNFKTCVRPLSVGSFYLKGATIFGFVKSMRPNKDTLFKNSSKNALFVYTLLTIFVVYRYHIILRTIPLLQVIHSRC